MSTNKTQNYQLNQWVKSDRVLMEEFNDDNAKIDAALKAHDTALASKASTSALNSLRSTVNGKASQSALDTLSATVAQHTSALTGKGNCILYTTSYTGDGQSNVRKSLTFPGQPWLVIIGGGDGYLLMVRGADGTPCALGSLYPNTVTWSGNTVTWIYGGSGGSGGMMNAANAAYQVIALLQAD